MSAAVDIVARLGGPAPRRAEPDRDAWLIVEGAERPGARAAHAELRRREFVERQGLFARDDADLADEDPETRALVAVRGSGEILGGVRIHPARPGSERIGWWQGSRLVVDAGTGPERGRIGAALVRAACARALDVGALRFDAHVQASQARFFARLGWDDAGAITVAGRPHRLMRWDLARFRDLAAATKASLGPLVGELLAHDRWRGDDGVPVPESDLVVCTDAIVPAMVAEDPAWAGWCGMLVTAHDLAAMGAMPVGVLDALAAPDVTHAQAVLGGLRAGSEALGLPVLGGHTSLGAPAALALTGLGRSDAPIPAGAARPGDAVTVCADLAGGWRPGYAGRQWDSSTGRTREELAAMLSWVARARPRAAKDVSMAGLVGTLGMLAEASGGGAELEVAAIPRPSGAELADWLTCFPGYAMLACAGADARPEAVDAGPARAARCGRLTREAGVRLRWPDGALTEALGETVTGLGASGR